MHPFDADSAVVALGDGRYAAELSDRWDRLGGGPLGGYSLAVALRALAGSTSFPDPLVLSACFLRPAEHGRADIVTEQIRHGRATATVTGSLTQDGRERLRLLATFTDLDRADGPSAVLVRAPDLPAPDDCVDPFEAIRPSATVADRVEYRFPQVPGWLRGEPSGTPTAEGWIRIADKAGGDGADVAFLVDAAPPVVLELGASGSSTIELAAHFHARPAPGWLAFRAVTRCVIDGYHEEDFELWDSDGRLVAQSRQLARLHGQVRAGPLAAGAEVRGSVVG